MKTIIDIENELEKINPYISLLQKYSLDLYGCYDLEKSLLWLMEEVGELVAAIRKEKSEEDILGELSDTFAWMLCLVNILDKDLNEVIKKSFLKEASRQYKDYGSLKYHIEH